MIKVGLIGGWHVHAKGYGQMILNHPQCTLCGVWDDDATRGKELAEQLNCDFYSDADELIALSDGVIITSATNQHPVLISKAAKQKKDIFTEKVLAITLKEAQQLKQVIEENDIHFTISYPFQAGAGNRAIKKAVEEEVLGTITHLRIRNAHGGSIADWLPAHFYEKEACGGGAMMDLGAHPMYLIQWLLGMPKTITSAFTNITDRTVEDNAVCLMTFENGAIAISETSFVSPHSPYSLEISGTKGFLRVKDTVASGIIEGAEKTIKAEEEIHPMEYWIQSIINHTENNRYGIEEAVRLSAIMEGAYLADQQQKTIFLEEIK